jgi:hypothetical protein
MGNHKDLLFWSRTQTVTSTRLGRPTPNELPLGGYIIRGSDSRTDVVRLGGLYTFPWVGVDSTVQIKGARLFGHDT